MKNILVILISVAAWSGLAKADVIDPTGTDAYKTLQVKVTQLDQRTLPDGEASFITISLAASEQFYSSVVPEGQTLTKQQKVPKSNSGTYYVSMCASKYYQSASCPFEKRGTLADGESTIEIRMKRIDVNPMVVTRPDGSTYIPKTGTVEVYYLNFNQEWDILARFNIGEGIDVPVGVVGALYFVQVSVNTEDGVDTYKSKLDFRNL